MKLKLKSATVSAFFLVSICSLPVFGNTEDIFDRFGAIQCEDELARLDNLAVALMNSPDTRVYVVIYGGSRGTYRDEVKVRAARMKRHLVENRGLSPERVKIINGGFREELTVELRVVPADKPAPTASPTIDATTVRYRKGKMARYREPGCFPGKYLNEKFHHSQTPVTR